MIGNKMSELSPIKHDLTAADQVEQKLVLAIARQELVDGERLTESGLGKLLNVSRVPVREATQRLLTYGVLESAGARGLRVSDYGELRVKDLMEIRLAVEQILLKRVMEDTDKRNEVAVHLQEIVDRMAALSSEADAVALSGIDLEFHKMIARHSQNDLVESVWDCLTPHLRIVFCRDWNNLSKRTGEVQDHQTLIDFIKEGNPDDVQTVLKQHFPTIQRNRVAGREGT